MIIPEKKIGYSVVNEQYKVNKSYQNRLNMSQIRV